MCFDTPTTIMVASGVGTSQGVLIKVGDAMAKVQKVKFVVFDKTWSLTIGKPLVNSTLLLSIFSRSYVTWQFLWIRIVSAR